MKYQGTCYQAESGQWSWVIMANGEDYVRGSGYETEDDAFMDMYDELQQLSRAKDE